jgi:hypothetical protein
MKMRYYNVKNMAPLKGCATPGAHLYCFTEIPFSFLGIFFLIF